VGKEEVFCTLKTNKIHGIRYKAVIISKCKFAEEMQSTVHDKSKLILEHAMVTDGGRRHKIEDFNESSPGQLSKKVATKQNEKKEVTDQEKVINNAQPTLAYNQHSASNIEINETRLYYNPRNDTFIINSIIINNNEANIDNQQSSRSVKTKTKNEGAPGQLFKNIDSNKEKEARQQATDHERAINFVQPASENNQHNASHIVNIETRVHHALRNDTLINVIVTNNNETRVYTKQSSGPVKGKSNYSSSSKLIDRNRTSTNKMMVRRMRKEDVKQEEKANKLFPYGTFYKYDCRVSTLALMKLFKFL